MPVPGDFQLTSEQKGILKQALHYKRAWESDEKTAFDTAFKTTLENANRDVARIILQTQEQQGVLPSLTPTSTTTTQHKQRNATIATSEHSISQQAGNNSKKKSDSCINSRGGGLSPVPSVVLSSSSVNNNIPPHQRVRYNNNTINNRLFPLQQLPELEASTVGRRSGRGGGGSVSGARSEASHHAVSSVLCRDASDVSAASTRVRDLEARLKNEEAKRIQVHNELQEIRALIESKLGGGMPPKNNNTKPLSSGMIPRMSSNGLDDVNNIYRRGTPATKQVSLRALSNGRHTVDLRSKVKTGKGVVDPAPYAYRLQ